MDYWVNPILYSQIKNVKALHCGDRGAVTPSGDTVHVELYNKTAQSLTVENKFTIGEDITRDYL